MKKQNGGINLRKNKEKKKGSVKEIKRKEKFSIRRKKKSV